MSKALEAAPLRDKLLLAISEVHSGNGAEGERIADAVLSVLSAASSPDVKEVAGIAGRLHEALGWFLNDTRFQVGVGGNPRMVESMIAEAHEVFNEASAAIAAMCHTNQEPTP